MSYEAQISFKKIDAENIYSFFISLKAAIKMHLKDIAKEEMFYLPSIRYHRKARDSSEEYTIRDADDYWASRAVFNYRYFYLKDVQLLGVYGIYSCVQDIFDATIFFQNSTDQDYERIEYKGIDLFEAIYDKHMNDSEDDIKKKLLEDDLYEEAEITPDKIAYEKRLAAYDEIWQLMQYSLFDEDQVIYASFFGWYESNILRTFCELCKQNYKEWEEEWKQKMIMNKLQDKN